MQAYYGIADPRIKHYGIANTIMEGFDSSGLRRELELVCKRVATRPDIASKVIKNVEFEADKLPHTKNLCFLMYSKNIWIFILDIVFCFTVKK